MRSTNGRSAPFAKLCSGLALALAATLGFAATADAKPHGRCGDESGGGLAHLERKVERLELAPETQQAVFGILDAARTEQRGLRGQIRDGRERMKELLAADAPSTDEVLALADSIGALQTEQRKNALRAMVEIRGLLTADQWQELHSRKHFGRRGGIPGERTPL